MRRPIPDSDEFAPDDDAPRWGVWPWVVLLVIVALLGIGTTVFPAHRGAVPYTPELARVVTLRVLAAPVDTRLPVDGAAYLPASREAQVAVGGRVRTGDGGRAELLFPDGSIVRMNALTEVSIAAVASTKSPTTAVELLIGEVWTRVGRLLPGGVVDVRADDVTVSARQTAFSVRRRAGRLAVYAVEHDVSVRLSSGTSTLVREARSLDIDPKDAALRAQGAVLPVVAQDAGFLRSKWRATNLAADADALGETGAGRTRCLIDITACGPDGPRVSGVKVSVVDGQALATIELAAWDGRLLHVVWMRGATMLRDVDVAPAPNDRLVQDTVAVPEQGEYTVTVSLGGTTSVGTTFVVGEPSSSTPPSSAPPSAPPSGNARCPTPTTTAICGLDQFYVDKDEDCSYESCRTCLAHEVPTDADGDGILDSCIPSARTCVDPGVCPNGTLVGPDGCSRCAEAASLPASDPVPSSAWGAQIAPATGDGTGDVETP